MSRLAAALCIAVSGCASIPVDPANARLQALGPGFHTTRQECPTCAVVNVTRDIGFLGGCSVSIYFDGAEVGSLTSAESVEFLAVPGPHVLEAEPGLICAGGRIGQSVNLLVRQDVGFRVGRDQNTSLILAPSYVHGGEAMSPNVPRRSTAERLHELDELFASGAEYGQKRKQILDGL